MEDTSLINWTWSPRFREDSLVLEQSTVLPLAIQYALARLPGDCVCPQSGQKMYRKPFKPQMVAFRGAEKVQAMLTVASQLSSLLLDNGHSQLTLQCTTQVLSG